MMNSSSSSSSSMNYWLYYWALVEYVVSYGIPCQNKNQTLTEILRTSYDIMIARAPNYYYCYYY
eukprot:16436044-Heterocapsa_arctica.AAC.1